MTACLGPRSFAGALLFGFSLANAGAAPLCRASFERSFAIDSRKAFDEVSAGFPQQSSDSLRARFGDADSHSFVFTNRSRRPAVSHLLLCVGALLGNQPEPRIRGYRLHLWIAGICACFILMWYAAGAPSFSGQQIAGVSLATAAQMIAPRVLLLYLGIYLASRASGWLTGIVGRLPIRLGTWLDRFVKTPTETFTETNRKMRAILFLVLSVSGVWAVVTGDMPTGMSIAKDLVGLFDSGK